MTSNNPLSPVLLILGAGPRIGQSVANAFAAKGYRVAVAARSLSPENSTADKLFIKADLSDPASISDIFAKVKELFGPPSVVVYNATSRTVNDPLSPLTIDHKQLQHDVAVNTFSVLAAAEQAVKGFEELPETASKTFIFTGNFLNETPRAEVLGYGMCKAATANLMQGASMVYKAKGYKFYYADERNEDGFAVFMDLSGEAAADFYVKLAEGMEQGPWQATHVKGKGYVKFLRRDGVDV